MMIMDNVILFPSLLISFLLLISFALKDVQSLLPIPILRLSMNSLDLNYADGSRQDAFLNPEQLIRKYRYPAESHYVTTDDGYILNMHRIAREGAPPVFLMHGLLDSSSTWVVLRPEGSLGYYLYDNGYDVWMGNARGNRYSRNHTTLNPNFDANFWNFSWHEIGVHDLPAMINYVLDATGFQKLGYFGHSQGTTAFFVMASMRPELNHNISIMHALAPVAFMGNISNPLLPMARSLTQMTPVTTFELLPHTYALYRICSSSKMLETSCINMGYQFMGPDYYSFNHTLLPTIFGHVPAGSSFKQTAHYLQLVDNNRFCQYDYGKTQNRQHYGEDHPPDYPLSEISAPVALYYGKNDYLSSVYDVQWLSQQLPNVVEDHLYPQKQWNHISMLYGLNSRKLAHERMLELLKKYTENLEESDNTE